MKLIRELLESRFIVVNPIPGIKAELKNGDYYVDDMMGENLIVVYKKDATEEDDTCVEVSFERHGGPEVVTLGLYVKENLAKTETFKPHFESPTSKGYFEEDEIASYVDHMFRDAEYLGQNTLNISSLHDDPDIRARLKERERAKRMGRR